MTIRLNLLSPWKRITPLGAFAVSLLAAIHLHAGPVQDIIDATPNGGVALIPPGDYPERIYTRGRLDLTIRGSGDVTIRGGMTLDEGGGWLVENISFQDRGISVVGADVRPVRGVTFRNCKITDILSPVESLAGTGINFAFTHDIVVEDCEIARTGYHCIRIVSACKRVRISRNHFHDGEGDGIAGGPIEGDFIVESNLIHDFTNTIAHGDGIQALAWGRLIIRWNRFWDSTQNIFIEPYQRTPGSEPVIGPVFVYGNTVENTKWVSVEEPGWYNGIVFDLYRDISEAYVYNNTLIELNAGSGGLRFDNRAPGIRVRSGFVMNNIVRESVWSVPRYMFGELSNSTNAFSNEARPGWIDPWIEASPGSREVEGGFDGDARPTDDRFDFGYPIPRFLMLNTDEKATDMPDGYDLDPDHSPRGSGPWTVGAFVFPAPGVPTVTPTPSPTAALTPTPTATPTETPTPSPTPVPDVSLGVLIGSDGHRYRIMRSSAYGILYGVRVGE